MPGLNTKGGKKKKKSWVMEKFQHGCSSISIPAPGGFFVLAGMLVLALYELDNMRGFNHDSTCNSRRRYLVGRFLFNRQIYHRVILRDQLTVVSIQKFQSKIYICLARLSIYYGGASNLNIYH